MHTLTSQIHQPPVAATWQRVVALLERIPHGAIALIGRVSIAATFWMSGQTKIEGLVVDPIAGTVELGWPRVTAEAIELFASEYTLPVIAPAPAATLAAIAEHVFPLLLLVGLATRLSAIALLVMTLVIQIFVYPAAFATHGVWASVLLDLIARGPGMLSLDHLIASRLR